MKDAMDDDRERVEVGRTKELSHDLLVINYLKVL